MAISSLFIGYIFAKRTFGEIDAHYGLGAKSNQQVSDVREDYDFKEQSHVYVNNNDS